MIYDLGDKYQRAVFELRVRELLNSNAIVELTNKKRRTMSQKGYLYVIIRFFASEYGCSEEYAKQHFYKDVCNHDIFYVQTKSKRGMKFEDVKSSEELTSEEMSLSIERFKNYSAMHGILLPDADNEKSMAYAQRQIAENAAFLL